MSILNEINEQAHINEAITPLRLFVEELQAAEADINDSEVQAQILEKNRLLNEAGNPRDKGARDEWLKTLGIDPREANPNVQATFDNPEMRMGLKGAVDDRRQQRANLPRDPKKFVNKGVIKQRDSLKGEGSMISEIITKTDDEGRQRQYVVAKDLNTKFVTQYPINELRPVPSADGTPTWVHNPKPKVAKKVEKRSMFDKVFGRRK